MMVTDIGGYSGPICQSFAKVVPKKFRPEFMLNTDATDGSEPVTLKQGRTLHLQEYARLPECAAWVARRHAGSDWQCPRKLAHVMLC
jgi:hypothetical protein